MVFGSLTEVIMGTFALQFYPLEVMQQNSFVLIPFLFPITAVLYGVCWLIEKRDVHPGVSLLAFIKRKRDNKIPAILMFYAAQIFSFVLIFSYRRTNSLDPRFIDTILLIAAVFTLISLILVLKLVTQTRNDAIKMTQDLYIEDINRMFTTVRGQRHDFLNHVQVISSFVRMDKKEELQKYTQELVGEISEINEIMSIDNPALAALIQAKCAMAISRKIQFNYDCTRLDSSTLGIKSIDLIKILGNLLDNAFDEAQALSPEERIVTLECKTEMGSLIIFVNNKGSYITENARKKIFETGFSTKTGEHRGLGLTIVKERTEFYRGSIDVQSSHGEGTSFTIKIPQKNVK
jgi:sensor histidine kinase regulating citrate/malate metabolism